MKPTTIRDALAGFAHVVKLWICDHWGHDWEPEISPVIPLVVRCRRCSCSSKLRGLDET